MVKLLGEPTRASGKRIDRLLAGLVPLHLLKRQEVEGKVRGAGGATVVKGGSALGDSMFFS